MADAHVDHAPPHSFDSIVELFLSSYSLQHNACCRTPSTWRVASSITISRRRSETAMQMSIAAHPHRQEQPPPAKANEGRSPQSLVVSKSSSLSEAKLELFFLNQQWSDNQEHRNARLLLRSAQSELRRKEVPSFVHVRALRLLLQLLAVPIISNARLHTACFAFSHLKRCLAVYEVELSDDDTIFQPRPPSRFCRLR